MSKKIVMKIRPDGKIEAHVEGVKGKKCVSYIKEIEDMLGARVVNMTYTPEYYESEEELLEQQKARTQQVKEIDTEST
jgi:hypothetical protein